ncbi:MAG: hydrogenase maturation nickel metallochaperone HypA [Rhodocyclaceae bacterium]|nr:hydrogenase maturation nickel metallochaperone HypA [Rhodocyclaceae bacterium]
MHEISLAENIIQLIECAARRDKFSVVRTVFIDIGTHSCVSPDALAFCFESVAKGGMAENARLEISTTPGDEMRVRELEVI